MDDYSESIKKIQEKIDLAFGDMCHSRDVITALIQIIQKLEVENRNLQGLVDYAIRHEETLIRDFCYEMKDAYCWEFPN